MLMVVPGRAKRKLATHRESAHREPRSFGVDSVDLIFRMAGESREPHFVVI